MSKCATCRHWSELVAKVEAGTTVAMCMNGKSPKSGKYTAKWMGCDKHEEGAPDDLDHLPPRQREKSKAYRLGLALGIEDND